MNPAEFNIFKKFTTVLKNQSLWTAIEKSIYKIIGRPDPITYRRLLISNKINNLDRASMLLGIYEKEIMTEIVNASQKYSIFIDVGAADGYYGIGTLKNSLYKKSYCFEMSDKGRSIIEENAKLNNVQNQVIIHGKADFDFHKKIDANDIGNSLLLIDIEGSEFDLLTDEVLNVFSNSIIIIELHDWFYEDGDSKLNSLVSRASKLFQITTLTTGERNPSLFHELKKLDDTDRWLICSEGRGQLMTWLKLSPK